MLKKGVWFAIVLGVAILVGVVGIVAFLPAWKKANDPFLRGKQLFRDGQYPEAAEAYREAMKVHPANSLAGVELGRTLTVMKQYDAAILSLKDTAHQFPRVTEGWQLLGEAYAAHHQPKEASDAYLHALAVDSKLPHTHLTLGQAYDEMGKKAEARAEWKQVILLDPYDEGRNAQKMINLQHK